MISRTTTRDAMTARQLLLRLVNEGHVITDPGRPFGDTVAVNTLVASGYAEIVNGPNRAMLRATFSGRKEVMAWRNQ